MRCGKEFASAEADDEYVLCADATREAELESTFLLLCHAFALRGLTLFSVVEECEPGFLCTPEGHAFRACTLVDARFCPYCGETLPDPESFFSLVPATQALSLDSQEKPN